MVSEGAAPPTDLDAVSFLRFGLGALSLSGGDCFLVEVFVTTTVSSSDEDLLPPGSEAGTGSAVRSTGIPRGDSGADFSFKVDFVERAARMPFS